MDSMRTFVAVDLSPENRKAIQQVIRRLEPTCEGVKWVNPDLLHLTLHFLGDVYFSDIHAVCKAIEAAAADVFSFEMHLSGLGAFPDPEHPKVIWVGVADGHEGLVQLQRELNEPLAALGYPSDRNLFKPHITIGRVKRVGAGLQELSRAIHKWEASDFGLCCVDQVVVYQSQLHRAGPEYTPIAEIELR